MPDHRRKFSGFVFFAVTVFCVLPLHSQDSEDSFHRELPGISGTIISIEVTGLKRTKPHIARYPLEKFLGREGSTLDLNEVKAAVKDTEILEPVVVELTETEGGLILRVTVEEKWSLFPVPLVMGGSAGYDFGLFLADTNAFGMRDTAALGGMYGSAGWLLMTMYNHTPNRKGLPGWNGFFMYTRREHEDSDRKEKIHRRYTADALHFSLGLNYPFTGSITGFVSVSFTGISPKKNDNAFNNPEKEVMYLGLTPGFALRFINWDGYLLSQKGFTLRYSYNMGIYGSSFHELEFQGVFEQSLIPGFRFNLRNGTVWKFDSSGDLSEPLLEDGPSKAHVDILPRKFSAMQYIGFSAGLEKYLYKNRWGTLSILGSWNCVFSRGPISGFEFDNGPSGGIRVYLSRLAIPALGAGIAYNLNSGLFQFYFSIGMSF